MLSRLAPQDARLLDEFQRDFPLTDRPFATIGAALDLPEAEVLARLAVLRENGAVSRVGATVRPNTAGASTLAAMAVPEGRVEEVAATVGAEPGVNHSYLREDDWNLWFVATAPDTAGLERCLARIAQMSGLQVLDLRLVRPFNIDLGFRLDGRAGQMAHHRPTRAFDLQPVDRSLLQKLSQGGLPLVPAPYAQLARQLGLAEGDLVARIAALQAAGVITRLGVIVRHRPLGWTANAMVVWNLPDDRIPGAGADLAALPGVTLCYQRRSLPGVWPYGLYSMIHGKSRADALSVLARARALPALQGAPHRVLFSTRCFKQTGARIAETEAA